MRALAILLLAGASVPAMAQDHSGHDMSGMQMKAPSAKAKPATKAATRPKPAAKTTAKAKPAARASAPAKSVSKAKPAVSATSADSAEAAPDGETMADMSTMDHASMGHPTMDARPTDQGGMDHSAMDHGAMEMTPIPLLPPPAEAGSGPPRAAEAIWGADAMRASRDQLRRENGGQSFAKLLIDRFEYKAHQGRDGYAWEGQAWIGGDLDRFVIKSEGEGAFGDDPEHVEVQGLYSHAIGPWFDVNAGVRQDLTGPDRTHLVVGVQGLAPYEFEVDGNLFLSSRGDLTARAEAELDQRITQRLILQPRIEANLSAQDIPELGIGAGLDKLEAGLRLRYEFAREFAPYVGVTQEWRFGRSADYARLRGDDTKITSFVAGLRFWF